MSWGWALRDGREGAGKVKMEAGLRVDVGVRTMGP
jgi:hypothetical protein